MAVLHRILEALTLSKNVLGLSAQTLLTAGREQLGGDQLHFELVSDTVSVHSNIVVGWVFTVEQWMMFVVFLLPLSSTPPSTPSSLPPRPPPSTSSLLP